MQLPHRLGGFELTQRLGSGAMGTVFAATQTSLGRRVVIKTLHPHLMEDPGLIARFEREARHAAGLQHPNTVQVYEFGREGNLHYIAMEFVDGLDLKEVLGLLGPFPPQVATLVLRDVCRGMEAAHRRDLVHRDIKPANLMITRNGVVKVMDFGLARETAESSTLTQHGSVMGSAAYMSPEQAQGQTVDHRTDVFSAGLVGYEIASGVRAFPGESYAAVLRAVVFDEIDPLRNHCEGLPEEFYEVITWMTVKSLDDRCPSMGAARDRLEGLAQRLGLRGEDRILAEFVRQANEKRGDESGPQLGSIGATMVSAETFPSDPSAAPESLGTRVADGGTPLAMEPAAGESAGAADTGGATGSADGPVSAAAAAPTAPGTDSVPRSSGSPHPIDRPAPPPTSRAGGSRKGLIGLVAVLVLAAAGFGAWRIFGGSGGSGSTDGEGEPALAGGSGSATAMVEFACCFDDGSCELFTESECREQRGVPGTGTSCEPNPCLQPPPRGACCFQDGSCRMREADECRSEGGEYKGDESDCRPNPCVQTAGTGPGGTDGGEATSGGARDADRTPSGDATPGGTAPSGTASGTPAGGTRTEVPQPPFEKNFAISTIPYAEVRVDDDATNRNIVGNFEMVLREGTHRFHIRNEELGVERTVTYRVKRNDPNNRIIIRAETGEVQARP